MVTTIILFLSKDNVLIIDMDTLECYTKTQIIDKAGRQFVVCTG